VTQRSPEQVFQRVKRLCYSGLEIAELKDRLVEELGAALSFHAYCFNQVDPTTALVTLNFNNGVGDAEHQRFFFENVYFEDYLDGLKELVLNRLHADTLFSASDGNPERTYRYQYLNDSGMDYGDELRTAFVANRRLWGSIALIRARREPAFTQSHVNLMRRLSPHVGAAMQSAVLQAIARQNEGESGAPAHREPGMMILGPKNELEYFTPAAQMWLSEIGMDLSKWPSPSALPAPVMQAVAALSRALSMTTESDEVLIPQIPVCGRSGLWLTIQASQMIATSGGAYRTLIMLEPAVPRTLHAIQTAAFGMTPQEEAVVQLVAQGASTQQIAETLYISPYTVQDYLKSVFDKVGVRSRRELVKQLFLEKILPKSAS